MLIRSALFSVLGFAWLPAALVVHAAGCGSSSSPPSSSSAVTSDQACTDSAHVTCTKVQSCTPATLQATYGDEATCELRLKTSCLNSLSAPSTGGTPDKVEACAQSYANYACVDYRNKVNLPTACLEAVGSLAPDAGCEFAAQCQSGFCAIAPGSACGTCAPPPQQGADCSQLTSCGQLLSCATDTFVCTTVAGQGQTCGMGQPCGAGLSCVAPGGAGTAGICQTAGAQAGAVCDGSAKTGPSCDAPLGLYCDGVTKACAQTTYAGGGQACGYDSTAGTDVACTAGSCQGSMPAQGQAGQCVARAADLGACTVPDGGASAPSAGCLPSARCVAPDGVNGTCQVETATSCAM